MAVKIFIDPGHGGTNPGAVGNGVIEEDVNLSVSKSLAEDLRNLGYDVKLYRTTSDENVINPIAADLRKRAKTANDWGADYFISVHTNSSVNPEANGFETYVYKLGTKSAELAESIQNTVIDELGMKNNGVKQANFSVLRNSQMPAVLVELGYLSNPTEALNLNSSAWRKKIAQAIAQGINKYVKSK